MFWHKQKLKLVTHNGSFHTDDVFAAATLSILLEKKSENFEIVRTREEAIIKDADYVFDVGGVYDPDKNRFDHHQVGGAGKHESGIEYASFGLVWKKFGRDIAGSAEAAELIDKRLVAPIDASDNGFDLVEKKHEIFPYMIQDLFRTMRPTWLETDKEMDKMFLKSVEIAKNILLREIIHARDVVLSNQAIISTYKNTQDKRILIFDKNYPTSEILNTLPEVLFVVYPREEGNSWGIKAVRKDSKSFGNKKDFPASWGGLRGGELAEISGIPDALFCHRNLFMATALSKEGAIALAQRALQN